MKMELRKMELEVESRRVEAEVERETRRMEMEFELEKQKMETEIRLAVLRDQGLNNTQEGATATVRVHGIDNSLAGRTKKFGDTLRHVLPQMPAEHAERPQFFDTMEKLFHIYGVRDDIQAKLLMPLLSSQAKAIIGRMTSTDLESYAMVKQFLLTEFRLTPREYKLRFDTATKSPNETYVLFSSRLRNLLSYILRSREVEDFNTLCELLVSDKLKSCLTAGTLNYVLSLEGNDWYISSKIASLADTYAANFNPRFGNNQNRPQRQINVGQGNTAGWRSQGSPRPQFGQSQRQQMEYRPRYPQPNNFG